MEERDKTERDGKKGMSRAQRDRAEKEKAKRGEGSGLIDMWFPFAWCLYHDDGIRNNERAERAGTEGAERDGRKRGQRAEVK